MPKYYDGLDDDGYPIVRKPGPWYVHGSEADVGENFNPLAVGGLFAGIVERAKAAMTVNPTSDSPIESILGAALILCFKNGGKPLTLAAQPEPATGLLLIPQFKWGVYRSDWAIYNPKTTDALLIECDGKDYHSSQEQVAHDQRKDQAAHDRGYLTVRFSGSKIHRDADGCARGVFDFVYGGKNGSHS